jgi:hypothetical protein
LDGSGEPFYSGFIANAVIGAHRSVGLPGLSPGIRRTQLEGPVSGNGPNFANSASCTLLTLVLGAVWAALNLSREWPLSCLGQNALAGAANSHFPPNMSRNANGPERPLV